MLLATRVELLSAIFLPIGIGLSVHGSLAPGAAGDPVVAAAPHQAVSYSEKVAPIFQARCSQCHGGVDEATGEQVMELGLNLTTYEGVMAGSDYGTVIEPGSPDASLLIEMIASGDMPQEGDPVPPEELEVIRTWIAEGAQNN
jgi:mono/diheme cytochrome c family protein